METRQRRYKEGVDGKIQKTCGEKNEVYVKRKREPDHKSQETDHVFLLLTYPRCTWILLSFFPLFILVSIM